MNNLQTIAKFLKKAESTKDLTLLLEDLLTPEEIAEIHQRVEILHMLLEGTPQRDIAAKLDCGIATVTRGSRIIKHGTGAAKKYLA